MFKNNEDVHEIPVKSLDADIEFMGLQSGDQLFVWLRNFRAELLNELTLMIEGIGNSKYLMKYYDTWTGKFSNEREIESMNDQLILKKIGLNGEKDMALWLRPARK